jgi:hypothetical protein
MVDFVSLPNAMIILNSTNQLCNNEFISAELDLCFRIQIQTVNRVITILY